MFLVSLNWSTFPFSSTEIDDMLRKSTNLLLTRTLSGCLQNLIRKPHIGLTEVSVAFLQSPCAYQIQYSVRECMYTSVAWWSYVTVLQLVQIIINTTHLEQACKYLEDFITNITNVSPETIHTTRLYGLSTFKVRYLASLVYNDAVVFSCDFFSFNCNNKILTNRAAFNSLNRTAAGFSEEPLPDLYMEPFRSFSGL